MRYPEVVEENEDMSIAEKLEEIHRLACEIAADAKIAAATAKTGPTRRFYAEFINSTPLVNIVNEGAGFIGNTVARAKAFEARLTAEVL
jgi:hypothetical protein